MSASVDLDGTSAVRPSARGQRPHNVPTRVTVLLLFFGAGLKRRLEAGGEDSGHGSGAFGGALLAATTFALVGMLEAAMANAVHGMRP